MTKRCDDEPRGVDEGFCGEPTRYFGGLGHGDGGEPGSCKEEDASVGGVAAAAAAAAAAASLKTSDGVTSPFSLVRALPLRRCKLAWVVVCTAISSTGRALPANPSFTSPRLVHLPPPRAPPPRLHDGRVVLALAFNAAAAGAGEHVGAAGGRSSQLPSAGRCACRPPVENPAEPGRPPRMKPGRTLSIRA
eukprot:1194360-Prorocentrum_minimum.AAC.7